MKRYNVSANRYNDLWNVITFQQTVITVFETVITVQTGTGTGDGYTGAGTTSFFQKKTDRPFSNSYPFTRLYPGTGTGTAGTGYELYPAGFSKPLGGMTHFQICQRLILELHKKIRVRGIITTRLELELIWLELIWLELIWLELIWLNS
jgi:hypothetical protein